MGHGDDTQRQAQAASDAAFAGQVAVVTGAGRGIGAAVALLLARSGAQVALLSRTLSELEETKQRIDAACGPGRALTIPTDVSAEAQVSSAFAQIREALGPVRVLINNAGHLAPALISEMTLDNWEQTMAVNLRGTFLCARAAFAQMRESKRGGSIVNISSLGGIRSTTKFAGLSAYSAAKAGVVGFTECLNVEGQPFGIRVNCVAPGAVDTRMQRSSMPMFKPRTQPADIAEVIVFLADAKRARTLNGATIEVNSNE